MLLAQEPHTVQYLPGAGPRCLEPRLEIGVLTLESLYALGVHPRCARSTLERFHTRFSLKSAATERSQLVTEMPNELL